MIMYSESEETGDLWCWLKQGTNTGFTGMQAVRKRGFLPHRIQEAN
jgi:hypothetical protein